MPMTTRALSASASSSFDPLSSYDARLLRPASSHSLSSRPMSSSSAVLRPASASSASSRRRHQTRSSSPSTRMPSHFRVPDSSSLLPALGPPPSPPTRSPVRSGSTKSARRETIASPALPTPTADLRGLTAQQRDLFVYYRERIESFEAERCDFIGRVASLTRSAPPSAAASTWASQELAWQVAALQRHLSDARVALHEERRNALSAHALVHTVRLQALEERRRTAGQRPTEPKYAVDAQLPQKENRPPNVQRQPQYSTAAGAPVPRVPLRARHPLAEHGRSQKADPSAALLERTADDLRLLRSDEGRAASLRVEALNADRRVREKEHAAELSALRAAMARGRDEHAEISDRLHRTTRDYMALRHAAQRNEREHLERVATLSQQRDHMQHVLRALQHALKYAHEAAQPSLGTVGFASFDDSPTAASLSAASAAAASMTLSAGPEAAETSPLVPSGPSRRRVRPPLPSLGRPRVRGVVDERVIEYHAGEMHDLMHHCAQLERELQAARSQAEGAHSREDERARTAEDDAARWRRRAEREEERRRLAKEGYEVDLRRLRDHVRSLEGLVLHVDLARRRDRLSAGREVGDSDAQSGAASMFEVHVEQVEAAVRDMDDDLTRFAQRLADAQ